MPYLRIFDGESGSREYDITKPETVIGREAHMVDICLNDSTVSRRHALIKPYNDLHMIEDLGSSTGTFINGHKMECCQLAHGVNIQLGQCVMEYRTETKAGDSSDPYYNELRKNFALLPTDVTLRYRKLKAKPKKIFKTGDTLNFGESGILLPSESPLPTDQCLEVEITPANGISRKFLGEVLALIEEGDTPEMCIKLHFISKSKHAELTQDADEWVDGWPQ